MHMSMIASPATLDVSLFHAVNGLAGHHALLDALMVAAAQYSPQLFAIVLIALWASWRREYQVPAILAGGSAMLALGVGQIVGHALPRVRPFLAGHATLLIHHSVDTSFPSDHATLTFAVAALIFAFHRRLGAVLLALALWVAVARVYVGAHYPGDVLGGAVLGSVVSAGVVWATHTEWGMASLDRTLALLARVRLMARAGTVAGEIDATKAPRAA